MRREPATFDLDLRSFGRPADARARGHKMRRLSYYDLTTLSSYRATGNHGKRKRERKRERERERKTGKGRQVEPLSWTVATTASVSQIHADSNSSMKPLCLMLEDSYTCKTVPLSE